MTGFFATLAARAVGAPAPLQPRPAHRFEGLDAASAAPADAPVVVDDRPIGPPPAPTQPSEPTTTTSRAGRSPSARRTGQHVSVHEHTAHGSATEATPAPPAPAVAAVASTSQDEIDRAVHAARTAAERAARLAADQPGRVRSHVRPAPWPPRPSPVNAPDDAATPPAAAASADPDAEPGPAGLPTPLDQVEPTSALTRALAEQQQVESEHDDAPPAPRAPSARPRTRPAQPVDLAALLREQVFAALAERGSVPEGLTPVVSTTPTRRPPRPGTAALHAEGVRIDQPTEQAAPGDVHVHIARVSVTQPAPPPPPRVSRSETVRRTVDHQGYLARRRERG